MPSKRDEVVLRLHHVGGFDGEQRLPNGHGIAGLDEQLVTRPA